MAIVAAGPQPAASGAPSCDFGPRKSIRLPKSGYLGGDPFLLTWCTSRRRDIFARPSDAAAALASIRQAESETEAVVYCAVVMPDHIHAVVAAQTDKSPLDTAYCAKRLTTVGLRRLGLSGAVWERRVHDRGLRCTLGAGSVVAAVQSVLDNPVRHGLASSWKAWPHHFIAEGVLESL